MPLQAQTAEKLAEGLRSHPAFEAEHQQRGSHQADQPGAACLGFPQRRLRVTVAALNRLEVSMYAAFGKPGVIRQAPDALLAVCTNRVANDNTLGPQSHGVGPCSEGWLPLEKSALQSTRSTAGCPALRGCPYLITDMTATLYEQDGPSTIVLVAGDADYVPPLTKALDKGWRNEVVFTARGVSTALTPVV